MYDDTYFLKIRIRDLFEKSSDRDINERMQNVADYYLNLAENLDITKLLSLDKDLIKSFESVYLWLRDRLVLYPHTFKEDIETIVNESKLLELFSILTFLSEEELIQIRKRLKIQSYPNIIKSIIAFFQHLSKPQKSYDNLFSSDNILKTKISLHRLSQVVKYVSSYELLDYDESYEAFKEHYNPNLIDKSKVVALINVIKYQTNQLIDSVEKKKILDRLDEIEEEVKKKKVRWGSIIASLFMLLGFISDLKTVTPGIYENIYNTTSKIINVILEDGQVQRKEQFKLIEFHQTEQDATKVDINNQLEK